MKVVFSDDSMAEFVKVMMRVGFTKTFIESHDLCVTAEESCFKPFSVGAVGSGS